MKLVLLPGLDGTGLLFKPLLRVLPSHISSVVISYPTNEALSYAQLLSLVRESLPIDEDYVLLAESFSGPLAVELVAMRPPHLKGLILCATFLSNPAPVPKMLSSFISRLALKLEPPQFIIRRYLLGKEAPACLFENFRKALRSVSPDVLAFRIRSVMEVNAQGALEECRVPILYLAANQDELVRERSLTEMQRIKPQIVVIKIDGPHFLLQSQPEKCVRAIEQFLSSSV